MLNQTWRTLVRKYVVYDIPDEMAACFDCDKVNCADDNYRTCPYRLAYHAATEGSAGRRPEAATCRQG